MWQFIYDNSPWPNNPKLSRNLVSATHSFLAFAILTARYGIKYELVVLNSVSYFIWDLIYIFKNKIEPVFIFHHILSLWTLLSDLDKSLVCKIFYYGELSNFPMYFVYHCLHNNIECFKLKVIQAFWYPYFRVYKLFPYLINYFQHKILFYNLIILYFLGIFWSGVQFKKLIN